MSKADIKVVNEGTIFLFMPLTKKGARVIKSVVQSEPWQWLGGSLAVDHRFALDLATGLANEGLRVI